MNPLYFLSIIVILIKWHHCYLLWQNDSQIQAPSDGGEIQSTFDYGEGDDNYQDDNNYNNNNESSSHFDKRSITNVGRSAVNTMMMMGGGDDGDGFRYFNVGVLMASHLDSPFDLERCGPAVDLALERVNEEFLKSHRIRLKKVQGR